MRDLNDAVRLELDGVHYATMVAVGFHNRRGLMVMTNAGHPPGLWYRAHADEWSWFEPQRAEKSLGVRGTPLGLLPDASYDRMTVKPIPVTSSCSIPTVSPKPRTRQGQNWAGMIS